MSTTTKNSTDQTLRDAIKCWGKETQVDKAIEEMAELTKALIKYRHKEPSAELYSNVCNEIADVENLMQQLRFIFDPDDILVTKMKNLKIRRLRKIIDEGGKF